MQYSNELYIDRGLSSEFAYKSEVSLRSFKLSVEWFSSEAHAALQKELGVRGILTFLKFYAYTIKISGWKLEVNQFLLNRDLARRNLKHKKETFEAFLLTLEKLNLITLVEGTNAESLVFTMKDQSSAVDPQDAQDGVKEKIKKPIDKIDGKLVAQVIGTYCRVFKLRYNVNPLIGHKESGIIRALIKSYGVSKTSELVSAYLRMSDRFFLTKSHDLPTLQSNSNKINHFMASNKRTSVDEARQIDLEQANDDLIRQIEG